MATIAPSRLQVSEAAAGLILAVSTPLAEHTGPVITTEGQICCADKCMLSVSMAHKNPINLFRVFIGFSSSADLDKTIYLVSRILFLHYHLSVLQIALRIKLPTP